MRDYGRITQGSILNNVRVAQFPGVSFLGIIVTARCDIANCKVPKFHYLTAATIKDWIRTEGLLLAIQKYYDSEIKQILQEWKNLPNHQEMIYYSLDKIKESISDACVIEGYTEKSLCAKKKKTIERLESLRKFTKNTLTESDADEFLKIERIHKQTMNILEEVIGEKRQHYCFLPHQGYNEVSPENPNREYDGIIINLLDINVLDYPTAEKIESQDLDFDKLTSEQIEKYNKMFFLTKSHDIIYPETIIRSPYLEWVMQKFSNAFIRIGVDYPDKDKTVSHWKKNIPLEGDKL